MQPKDVPDRGKRRKARPLDPVRLEELALAYVARFATTAARLEAYLLRKLRERGWEGDSEADPAQLVARFVERGYVDDAGFARARSAGLLRRGYGPRRVSEALAQAGIGEELRSKMRCDEATARHAALAMARKRRLGPFGAGWTDRAARQKQIAAMLRAGHALDKAAALVDAASSQLAEEWASEHDEAED